MEYNLADTFEAVAAAVGDREAIVWRGRRISYRQLDERANRLANVLTGAGLGARCERDGLAGHESHQDHLALYLYNGNEYLEGMVGAFKARVAPFNVNYRYVATELQYLLESCQARGIVYDARFAETLAAVRADLPGLTTLIQVDDGTDIPLLDGALAYEDAIAELRRRPPPPVERSPDDLYILCTGGTTGMPKGVLWRQADIFVGRHGRAAARHPTRSGARSTSSPVNAADTGGTRQIPLPPFMHGAGHWMAFNSFNSGNTLVIQDDTTRLDADAVWELVERESVNIMLLVGDAFGRPLVDALERSRPRRLVAARRSCPVAPRSTRPSRTGS